MPHTLPFLQSKTRKEASASETRWLGPSSTRRSRRLLAFSERGSRRSACRRSDFRVLPDRLRALIHLLARLPGVGEKTAQRYVLFLAGEEGALAADLGRELTT